MRQHWLLFFALCTPGIFAVSSRTLATDTDQPQVGPIDNGQPEQQHPLTTLDNASASQKCAVCEGITDMIDSPIEELFRAIIRIEPNSPEAICQVHAPFRQPNDQEIGRNGMEEVENVYLLKVAGNVYFDIYFGRSTSEAQGSSFALLRKQPDTESSSDLRRIRPVNPEWIDLDILKEWVGTCTHDHGEACEDSPYAAGLNLQRPSYLIDAVEGRLVDTSSITDKSLHYVALRHPRGNHDNYQSYPFVSTENIAQLQEPGALLSPRFAADMPATFRDAIELVRLLDYRYLWIPTLCIIQDDLKSQAETAKVGDILVGAVFSITQFFDIDSTQGIRGIKELTNPQPRSLVQQLQPWGEDTLVPVSQHIAEQRRIAKAQGRFVGQSGGPWIWTLQGAFLPRRQLLFGSNSVQWCCPTCYIMEVTAGHCNKNYDRLRSPESVRLDPVALDGQNAPHLYHWTDTFSLPWFSMDHYFRALFELTALDSSPGGDTLDAAAGLISRLGLHSQGSFLCGMPEELLDHALLFGMGRPEGLRGTQQRDAGPALQPNLPWPSWSWAGWSGQVLIDPTLKGSYLSDYGPEADIISTVEWYASDSPSPDASRRRLETRLWNDAKQRFQHSNLEPIPAGWTRQHLDPGSIINVPTPKSRNQGHPGFDNTVVYTHTSFPSLQFSHPVPMRNTTGEAAASTSQIRMTTERFLSGTVDRVFLYIRSSDYVRSYSNQPYHLYGGNGQHVGVLQSTASDDLSRVLGMPTLDYGNLAFQFSANQSEEVPRDLTARLEVIALSRMCAHLGSGLPEFRKDGTTRYQGDQYYEFYNVMWVEWTDGVAYRKGIGRVLAEFWEDLYPESINLLLG